MNRAYVRFYAELNDFLPRERRKVAFSHTFLLSPSIKDAIEGLGVPHTEVDLILVNGTSVDFDYRLQDGDRVSVYPVFESLDITPLLRVRPRPLRRTRFVLDVHLGRLASYLRMLGFDTLYRNDFTDDELARVSSQEQRILLTRDRGLLKRQAVSRGYCVRNTAARQQVVEVLRRFDLSECTKPFHRCMSCNRILSSVGKDEIIDRLAPKTRRYYDEYRVCGGCGKLYWKGSHYERMQLLVQEFLDVSGRPETAEAAE